MRTFRKWLIGLICILLTGAIVFVVFEDRKPKKPFGNLKASDMKSATVCLSPPGKTIQITELEELADCLNDIIIYNKDNSYNEYNGQAVVFTLVMADGTPTEIMEYNPFFVIDGVGYKTEYEPCEALNRYANGLLNEEK